MSAPRSPEPPDDAPRRVSGVTGQVSRGPVGDGSKSAHDAVWIDTGESRWVLRRKGGPSMGDPALDRYVGRRVRCDGMLLAHTLVADAIDVV